MVWKRNAYTCIYLWKEVLSLRISCRMASLSWILKNRFLFPYLNFPADVAPPKLLVGLLSYPEGLETTLLPLRKQNAFISPVLRQVMQKWHFLRPKIPECCCTDEKYSPPNMHRYLLHLYITKNQCRLNVLLFKCYITSISKNCQP